MFGNDYIFSIADSSTVSSTSTNIKTIAVIEVVQNTPAASSTFQEVGASNSEKMSTRSTEKYNRVQDFILGSQTTSLNGSS